MFSVSTVVVSCGPISQRTHGVVLFNRRQFFRVVPGNLLMVPHSDNRRQAIAREQGLCSALDTVLEESSRVNRKIVAAARDASRAVLNRKRSRDRYRESHRSPVTVR